ncbi:MAG: ABC transporter substrate-binding protein [Planctomycetota bacterium]|nr:ABC transporter substrate-binding protein [Planctomycetota bacterium]
MRHAGRGREPRTHHRPALRSRSDARRKARPRHHRPTAASSGPGRDPQARAVRPDAGDEPFPAGAGPFDEAAAFRTRYEGLLAGIDPVWEDGPPRVLVLGGWDPLYAMGRGSLLDDLLRICGCSNVACDLRTDASGPFSEELILARRPAWILVTSPEPMPARLQARWKNLPAVRDGQVAPAWADDVVRGGPRILDALERLHAVLRASKPPAYLGAMK